MGSRLLNQVVRGFAVFGVVLGLVMVSSTATVRAKESAAELFNRGVELLNKGDLDGAIAEYRTAAKLAPSQANAHYNLGVALHAKKDLDGAVKAFNTAISLDPKDADAHRTLGGTLMDKGDPAAAVTAYQTAITLNPDDPDIHYELMHADIAQKDLASASKELEEFTRLATTTAANREKIDDAKKRIDQLRAAGK